jgi:asparagine synthase (glutamine-hydrolysing)
MLGKLRHRGRGNRRIHVGKDVALGYVNRAVATGETDQHLCDDILGIQVVADARVYNRRQLRKRLSNRKFHTASDKEVLLRLYEEYGTDCARRIDGIFAFAIHDNGRLFVARDPLGVKPLYYASRNGSRCFASELKAIPSEYSDVRVFPPGHFYHSDRGFVRYFRFEREACADADPNELAENLKAILDSAVQKRLPSDGEVGILLSGGLDSSTVGVLATERASSVHSFAAGTCDSEDLKHARVLADLWGVSHHEYVYSIHDMLDVLPQVIYHLESFDYLLVRSSIANYLASKMAGDYVKVALSGEGSDELFAGYESLKSYASDESLDTTLRQMVLNCHNTGLQRVDRMNMASGVEGRMPYFDLDLLRFAFTVPACYKVHGDNQIEKWIVRKAFQNDLPHDITWRKKQKFSVGAGSYELISAYTESRISDRELERERRLANGCILRNKEELYYYRIFRDCFGDAPAVLDTVGLTPSA